MERIFVNIFFEFLVNYIIICTNCINAVPGSPVAVGGRKIGTPFAILFPLDVDANRFAIPPT
jgi:hypothetical protein